MRVVPRGAAGNRRFETRGGSGWPEAEGDQGARLRVVVPASA